MGRGEFLRRRGGTAQEKSQLLRAQSAAEGWLRARNLVRVETTFWLGFTGRA